MAQGFSVDAEKLAVGGQNIAGLQDWCAEIREATANALAGMAGSAGHAGLASALSGAERRGANAFIAMAAAYRHVSNGSAPRQRITPTQSDR